MSLLDTNIRGKERLSLQEAKLKKDSPILSPGQTKEALSIEEEALGELVKKEPLVLELVDRFSLVSVITGEPLRVDEDLKKPEKQKKTAKAKDGKKSLQETANKALQRGVVYSRRGVINKLKTTYQISEKRAERGIKALLEAGIIEVDIKGKYYLKDKI